MSNSCSRAIMLLRASGYVTCIILLSEKIYIFFLSALFLLVSLMSLPFRQLNNHHTWCHKLHHLHPPERYIFTPSFLLKSDLKQKSKQIKKLVLPFVNIGSTSHLLSKKINTILTHKAHTAQRRQNRRRWDPGGAKSYWEVLAIVYEPKWSDNCSAPPGKHRTWFYKFRYIVREKGGGGGWGRDGFRKED